MNYINKHAVISGGANGIGKSIALAFLREGAAVTIIDIDATTGEAIQRQQSGLQFFHGDIAEKSILEQFAGSLVKPVDYLINNACIGRGGLLSAAPTKIMNMSKE